MIFLTVGTQFAFDRLVMAVDKAVEIVDTKEEIYAQIGVSVYKPINFHAVSTLGKNQFDEIMRQASFIIGHAGIGTITMAFDYKKPLLVMPRLKKYGEVVNDHQLAIARNFEKAGHVLAAYTKEDLPQKIRELLSFSPRLRSNDTEVLIKTIREYLRSIDNPVKQVVGRKYVTQFGRQ